MVGLNVFRAQPVMDGGVFSTLRVFEVTVLPMSIPSSAVQFTWMSSPEAVLEAGNVLPVIDESTSPSTYQAYWAPAVGSCGSASLQLSSELTTRSSVVAGLLGPIVQPPSEGAVFWMVVSTVSVLPAFIPSWADTVQVITSSRWN